MAAASSSTTATTPPSIGDAPTNDSMAVSYAAITNGDKDVAVTMNGEKMRVQAAGRKPLQKVWLWTGSSESKGKKRVSSSSMTTNKPYKTEEDGPDVAGLPSRLPTDEELVSHVTAAEYIDVGLIIGNEPDRYKTGASRSKEVSRQRDARGEANRDPSAMRVFIPITPNIAAQAKYYVGVRPTEGRCFPRVVKDEQIYFYAEFWQGVSTGLGKKGRKDYINNTTKQHAAVNKSPADRSVAAITVTEMEARASTKPLMVTQAESMANLMVLQFSLLSETGSRDYIQGMLKEMDDAAPELKVGPHKADDGVKAFYDFGATLSDKDAQSVVRELKIAYPGIVGLDPHLIKAVHRALARKNQGSRLPYDELALFLSTCSPRLPADAYENETMVEIQVDNALDMVATVINLRVPHITSDAERISVHSHPLMLRAIKGVLQSVIVSIHDSDKALADQHGGVLQHASIKDVMNKIGNAVDVATLQSYFEQLGAFHAAQYTAARRPAVEKLESVCEMIDELLAIHARAHK